MKFAFGSIVVILGCLAGSTWSEEKEMRWKQGFSSFCDKPLTSWLYCSPHIRPECCSEDDYKCSDIIKPLQTKFGLTNDDSEYSRRSCKCEEKVFSCMIKNQSWDNMTSIRSWFKDEICIDAIEGPCHNRNESESSTTCVDSYRFVSVSEKFPHIRLQGYKKPPPRNH